ncbi:MAG: aminotransferase class I/II-fold pyridoxal phosphate-dependent enzyme [Coriobacteriaceae bacterium]|nr:aminotransferase class I/II-fold pyridoxal phosphate-dependent enzyme [Coriobacteriaceae bacterium]
MQTTRNIYQQMSDEELGAARAELAARVEAVRARGLKLDMARGKPSPAQVDISRPMLSVLNADSDLFDGAVDCSNYGCFEGIPSARALASSLLGCPADQTLVLGSSSLLIEHDILGMFWRVGTCGHAPWSDYAAAHGGRPVKILCPVPGYDRHFGISADLGIENVPVPMTEEGPDMDEVERLAAADDAVKGIWCVPKYSNPTGVTYTEETVRRLAEMRTAAPDFRILWDNAYCVHDLYDEGDELANIFGLARAAGTEDRVVAFASTSKITFPGAGVAFVGASPAVVAEFSARMKAGLISADKLNQLRHARFLPDVDAVRAHMREHARHLRPRFEAVERKLSAGLAGTGCATWTRPRGGYFVSFDGPAGSAKRVGALCAELGVTLTPAGATFPGGCDPADTNIRIAPSYPDLPDLEAALDVLVLAVRAVAADLAYEERA